MDKPKNNAVYFETSAHPAAAPTATHQRPPAPITGHEHLGEKEQDECGSYHQRRVRGDDQGSGGDHQGQIEENCGQCCYMPAKEHFRRTKHRPRHGQRKQYGDEPHPQFAVAGKHGVGADHEGDRRRVIVIAAGQMLRPQPVIGLVCSKRQTRGQDESRSDQDEHHHWYRDNTRAVSRIHRTSSRRSVPAESIFICRRGRLRSWKLSAEFQAVKMWAERGLMFKVEREAGDWGATRR